MPAPIDDQGAHFKGKLGMAVRSSVKQILQEHQVDREAFLASLEPEVRWFLTEHFIATKWYPLRGAGQMLEALARRLGEEPFELSRRVGHDVAFVSAGRVGITIVSLFGTPTRVAKYLSAMWGQLYDGGRVEGEFVDGILRVRRSDWPPHDPLLCATLLGSLECLAAHMHGFRSVDARRTACTSEGSSDCRFELRFETTG